MALQFSGPRRLVITNCTLRKRSGLTSARLPKGKSGSTLDALASAWWDQVKQTPKSTAAGDLYLGRSISVAKDVAHRLNADLYVTSAGLGLVKHDEQVPSYDLTVSPGATSIAPRLSKLNATSADWWESLNGAKGPNHPISTLAAMPQIEAVYMALPSSYIELVACDLAQIPRAALRKIRIFTSKPGLALLPSKLHPNVLPYDDRLESLPEYAGTRTEFPQRAMWHFVDGVEGVDLSLADAAEAVTRSLSKLSMPKLPARTRRTDDEIVGLIRKNWGDFDGNSARLLRFLRDDALVACEQSRFRDLWHVVRADLALGEAKR